MADGTEIGRSMWMSKDQATATSWCGPRFCPALLVTEPRPDKPKNKDKGKRASHSDDGPQVTLALTSTHDEVTVPQCSTPINLTIYALSGAVPPTDAPSADASEQPAEPNIVAVALHGPGIKRVREPEPDGDSKRHRATTLLLGSTGAEINVDPSLFE